MHEPKFIPKTLYGYAEGTTPIAVAVVTTEQERAAARSILSGMSQGHEPVVESPDSPWLATRANNPYSQHFVVEMLSGASEHAGFRTEFAGAISREKLELFVGHAVTEQVLGHRPGVL